MFDIENPDLRIPRGCYKCPVIRMRHKSDRKDIPRVAGENAGTQGKRRRRRLWLVRKNVQVKVI